MKLYTYGQTDRIVLNGYQHFLCGITSFIQEKPVLQAVNEMQLLQTKLIKSH